MAPYTGRLRLRGLAVLAVVLAVLLGPPPPSSADDRRPPGAAQGRNVFEENRRTKEYGNLLFGHPLFRPIVNLRSRYFDLLTSQRHTAFGIAQNGASVLIDPRKIDDLIGKMALGELHVDGAGGAGIWSAEMVDVDAVARFLNRDDEARLRNSNTPQVLVLSALSVPGDLHSEDVIAEVMRAHGISATRLLAGSSERQQCRDCAVLYDADTPTYFVGEWDYTTEEVRLQQAINSEIEKGYWRKSGREGMYKLQQWVTNEFQRWAAQRREGGGPKGLTADEIAVMEAVKREIEKEYRRKGAKYDDRLQARALQSFEKITKIRHRKTRTRLTGLLVHARKAAVAVQQKKGDKAASPFTTCSPKGAKAPSTQAPSQVPGSQLPGAPAQQALLLGPRAAKAGPCGEGALADSRRRTGLSKALATPGAGPGGIDFSSMELRYLSDPGDSSGLQYSFSADRDPMNGDSRTSTGLAVTDQTSDAFFVWLSLNPSAFWVNLNPNEPDRIVDSRLGRTDAGRIMLQADLRMKKTVAELIHPDTTTGRKFWDSVSGTCLSFRTWILSAPASVHKNDDKLYILDAPLDVQMETKYLQKRGDSKAVSCPQQDKAAEDHNERLFRSLILPKLKHSINTAPEYAALRRVYLARVAAEWYRELSRDKATTYRDLVDKGDIAPWQTESDWKPTDTFDKYVRSHTEGEFKVTKRTTSGNKIYVRTYSYGGVDLTRIPLRTVSDDSFAAQHADLTKDIDRSLNAPRPDAGGDTIWLGAPTPRQAAGLGPPEEPVSLAALTLRLLPALLVPLAALLWWRRRRLTASASASPLRRAAAASTRTTNTARRQS
ncbi:hypothetical protein [Streptomyces chryseus]|uniref:hypothetical protein n=1 Tax=Streptomyces chryseus TaxID=68186 RepID=UPI00110F7483|nr:hypothetical protein [Streptomyces chryseus]GGX23641.1 hypothetical protein GCM10010353_43350 [Streptomyces chryseus]